MEERTDSPVKTSQIRSFIKNIGLPSSPVLGKKAPPTTTAVSNVPPAKTVAASGRKVSTSAEPATAVAKNKGKETKQGWCRLTKITSSLRWLEKSTFQMQNVIFRFPPFMHSLYLSYLCLLV